MADSNKPGQVKSPRTDGLQGAGSLKPQTQIPAQEILKKGLQGAEALKPQPPKPIVQQPPKPAK